MSAGWRVDKIEITPDENGAEINMTLDDGETIVSRWVKADTLPELVARSLVVVREFWTEAG